MLKPTLDVLLDEAVCMLRDCVKRALQALDAECAAQLKRVQELTGGPGHV